MFRHPALHTLLLALAAAVSPGDSAARQSSPAELAERTVRGPDYEIPYGPEAQHFGELYLPEGPGPHPVLAFIHGGCFLSQFDIAHARPLARAIADEGIAVWSIEYRRVGNTGGGWPGTFQDVGRGLDHLREVGRSHPLDLDRAVLGGHSAGGTLALWAASRSKIEDGPLAADAPMDFPAVFGMAAVGDLEGVWMTGACGDVVGRLMGGGPRDHPDRWAVASPMQLVPLPVPATLLVGDRDEAWTPPSMSYFYRARTVADAPVRYVRLPESGHFEMIDPASTPTWRIVIDELRATFVEHAPGR